MNSIKKITPGIILTVITLLLSVISIIVYNTNIAGEGYFHNAAVSNAVKFNVLGIVVLAAAIVLALVPVEGVLAKVLTILSDVCRIVAPALFIAAVLAIVTARVEGFAFIYFSNVEVLQEVQTPANISSAHGAIANIVFLAITAVVGIVSAFFSARKEA